MLGSLAPARRRLVLMLVAVASIVIVALGASALVDRRAGSKAPQAAQQQQPGPVLLVPGYGGSTTGLDSLAAVLRQQGKDVSVLPLPGNGTGDLGVQAKALGAAVAATLARTGAGSVDVVGYSAGGVVARLWVRDYGGASLARRVVTLGSPQHGTDLAGLAGVLLPGVCPQACRQLEPGSSLLDGLNAGDETPDGPSFVSIWTTHDDVVIPPESASLAGALDLTVQSVCAGDTVGHSGLPTDRVVQGMVAAELIAGPPVALGPADCAGFSS